MSAATMAAMIQQQEEEKNITPGGGDWSQYEFKILRTLMLSDQFSDPVRMREVPAAEAVAGWELHEKLDDYRLRLRRRVSCRAKDALLTQDPYRSMIRDPRDVRRIRLMFAKVLGTALLVGIIGAVLMAVFSR